MPGARCARWPRVQWIVRDAHALVRSHRNHPAFPAQWVYGLCRTLPGDRAFLSPSPPESLLPGDLTPASRRQDHTILPSASGALVSSAVRGHRIPSRVRDDREPPLRMERDGREYKSDLRAGASTISENQNIFGKGAGQVFADLPVRVADALCRLSSRHRRRRCVE